MPSDFKHLQWKFLSEMRHLYGPIQQTDNRNQNKRRSSRKQIQRHSL